VRLQLVVYGRPMFVSSLILTVRVVVDDVEIVVDHVGSRLVHFLSIFSRLARIFFILTEISTEMRTMLGLRLERLRWVSVFYVLLCVLGMLNEKISWNRCTHLSKAPSTISHLFVFMILRLGMKFETGLRLIF
jgi:hypothetical protein